jgi:hypothetical protein
VAYSPPEFKDEANPLGPPADPLTATPLSAAALKAAFQEVYDAAVADASSAGGGGGAIDLSRAPYDVHPDETPATNKAAINGAIDDAADMGGGDLVIPPYPGGETVGVDGPILMDRDNVWLTCRAGIDATTTMTRMMEVKKAAGGQGKDGGYRGKLNCKQLVDDAFLVDSWRNFSFDQVIVNDPLKSYARFKASVADCDSHSMYTPILRSQDLAGFTEDDRPERFIVWDGSPAASFIVSDCRLYFPQVMRGLLGDTDPGDNTGGWAYEFINASRMTIWGPSIYGHKTHWTGSFLFRSISGAPQPCSRHTIYSPYAESNLSGIATDPDWEHWFAKMIVESGATQPIEANEITAPNMTTTCPAANLRRWDVQCIPAPSGGTPLIRNRYNKLRSPRWFSSSASSQIVHDANSEANYVELNTAGELWTEGHTTNNRVTLSG